MKLRKIIILLICYFVILFVFKGTEKTNEKLLDSIKYIVPVFIIAILLFKSVNKNNSNEAITKPNEEFEIPSRYNYMENFDPKNPIDFGIKTVWIAIQGSSTEVVAEYLNLNSRKSVNWVEGTIRAYEGEIFITPKLDNWILIHGFGLPTPDSKFGNQECVKLLNTLSNKFGEAYIFGNHRVSSVAFWCKSINGKLERLYVVADGTGETIGNPSKLEKEWNLVDLTPGVIPPNEEDWDKYLYPGEDEVIEMAKYWSINPLEISKLENVEGQGIIGRMNNRQ